MKRSALVLASVAVGMIAFSGPASSAAYSHYRTYNTHGEAASVCEAGKKVGRWSNCTFRPETPGPNPRVELWVA